MGLAGPPVSATWCSWPPAVPLTVGRQRPAISAAFGVGNHATRDYCRPFRRRTLSSRSPEKAVHSSYPRNRRVPFWPSLERLDHGSVTSRSFGDLDCQGAKVAIAILDGLGVAADRPVGGLEGKHRLVCILGKGHQTAVVLEGGQAVGVPVDRDPDLGVVSPRTASR